VPAIGHGMWIVVTVSRVAGAAPASAAAPPSLVPEAGVDAAELAQQGRQARPSTRRFMPGAAACISTLCSTRGGGFSFSRPRADQHGEVRLISYPAGGGQHDRRLRRPFGGMLDE